MPSNLNSVKLVPPKDISKIRKEAFLFRDKLGLSRELYFPVTQVLEWVMPVLDPEFNLQIIDDLLPGESGLCAEAIPAEHTIRIKQSVYENACLGVYYSRFVLAHELYHYLFHDPATVSYAFVNSWERPPQKRDPEWQANKFADELLAPVHLIKGLDAYAVKKCCGVSKRVAEQQLRQIQRIEKRHKKKRSGCRRTA